MKKLLLAVLCVFCCSSVHSQPNISKMLRVGDRDEYNNTVIYTHRNVSYYSWVPVAAQIKVDNKTNATTLIIKLYYSGSSWIFFDKVLFKSMLEDGTEKEFSIDVNVDNKTKTIKTDGGVIETVKLVPSADLIHNLKQFALNCNGHIRFEGQNYYNKKADKLYLKPFLETILIYEDMLK